MKIRESLTKMFKKLKNAFFFIKNRDTSFFILAICVCIIATAIIWTYPKKFKSAPDNSALDIEESYRDDINAASLMEDYINRIKEEYQKSLEKELQEEELEPPDLFSITAPISGVVAKEYSMDKLVYFETLDEWRVHSGIDIVPKETLIVKAAYSGKVEKISEDTLMGIEVILNHGGGVKTLYSCLSACKVIEGEYLEQGEQIGGVGKCSNIEMSEGPHLHFELIINDETVNPLDYFPSADN